MTAFENIGIRIQIQSVARGEEYAKAAMEYSCQCCCSRGIRIECDHCGIRTVHEQILPDKKFSMKLEF